MAWLLVVASNGLPNEGSHGATIMNRPVLQEPDLTPITGRVGRL